MWVKCTVWLWVALRAGYRGTVKRGFLLGLRFFLLVLYYGSDGSGLNLLDGPDGDIMDGVACESWPEFPIISTEYPILILRLLVSRPRLSAWSCVSLLTFISNSTCDVQCPLCPPRWPAVTC